MLIVYVLLLALGVPSAVSDTRKLIRARSRGLPYLATAGSLLVAIGVMAWALGWLLGGPKGTVGAVFGCVWFVAATSGVVMGVVGRRKAQRPPPWQPSRADTGAAATPDPSQM